MSMSSDLTLGMRTLQSYASEQCRIRGATVQCVATTESRGTTLTSGGKELEITLAIFVLKDDLLAAFRSQTQQDPASISDDSAVTTADDDILTSDDATAPPKSGEIVRYKERKYRIESVSMDSEEVSYKLDLKDINR